MYLTTRLQLANPHEKLAYEINTRTHIPELLQQAVNNVAEVIDGGLGVAIPVPGCDQVAAEAVA